MLNDIIKVDLHIHSFASRYKEDTDIVINSTAENLDILFAKLSEHSINMFSITDHNRFDSIIYNKAKEIIESNKYVNVQSVLAGVEFDVKLDGKKKDCHIVTIFDVKNNLDYAHIEEIINKNLLKNKDDFYDKEDFEKLLKDIGYDVILIACQRKSLDNKAGDHSSLSDSTDEPYEYLKVGYINALEYQKPHVEGILLNNLRDFSQSIGLITGSDCHDWAVYPKHDNSQQKSLSYFSKIKALPSFKGLLMAISSPKTRFNRTKVTNTNFLNYLSIKDKQIFLDSGINAIIGENGSGKTTLIKLITQNVKEKHYKNLIESNELKVSSDINFSRSKIIMQSEIINRFNEGTLFKSDDENLFIDLDHKDFESSIKEYSSNLLKFIEDTIKLQSNYNSLAGYSVTFKESMEESTYFVAIDYPPDFTDIENRHEEREKALRSIINLLNQELKNEYYSSGNKEVLDNVLSILKKMYDEVYINYQIVNCERSVKNIIVNKINEYKTSIMELTNSQDLEINKYKEDKENLKNKVISQIKSYYKQKIMPAFPEPIKGCSENERNGFCFKKVAYYHDINLKTDFYKLMFTADYQSEEKVSFINDIKALINAVRNASGSKYRENWNDNVLKVISNFEKSKDYILDIESKYNIGNTLGEISLVFYKYQTYNNNDWDLLVVDQPEDNISNIRISSKLINILNNLRIRSKKQIIFVTHSPLLVVNLDVDNVIYLNKTNEDINITAGCLEDDENKILDIIATNMDGGKDKIEKRLNLYGKDDRDNNE